MKINGLMFITSIAFAALVGLLISQHITIQKAASAGLKQCSVVENGRVIDHVWAHDCKDDLTVTKK